MKKTILLLCVLGSAFLFSQTGINTGNPQGAFHVDASKDNPATGTPTSAQQANDFTITDTGNVGVGTTTPSTKIDVISTIPGAIKITDGTQGVGKILISDANGVGTWSETTGTAVTLESTVGSPITLTNVLKYTGASATVIIPGFYIIAPRLITDKTPTGCGGFLAYNLSQSTTTALNSAFQYLDIYLPAGTDAFDFLTATNTAYLQAGTYYMKVRNGGGCTSNVARNNFPNNSFTLTLLK